MKVTKFTNTGFVNSNYSDNEDNTISKKALILVEGNHIDSKKREHNFPVERLFRIAENTNREFERGIRIPVLKDHSKTIDSTVGDLNSAVEVRAISSSDIANSRYSNLIGKIGLFASDVLIKSKDVIEKVKEGLISTISPGVDIMTDTIREISLTSTPAIVGMSLFSYDTEALTWDDMEQSKMQMDEVKEEFEDLGEHFLCLIRNIYSAGEDQLGEESPVNLVNDALQTYFEKVVELLGLDNLEPEEINTNPYEVDAPMAAYSMAEYAQLNGLAEFNYFKGFKTTANKAPNFWGKVKNVTSHAFLSPTLAKKGKGLFGTQRRLRMGTKIGLGVAGGGLAAYGAKKLFFNNNNQ